AGELLEQAGLASAGLAHDTRCLDDGGDGAARLEPREVVVPPDERHAHLDRLLPGQGGGALTAVTRRGDAVAAGLADGVLAHQQAGREGGAAARWGVVAEIL